MFRKGLNVQKTNVQKQSEYKKLPGIQLPTFPTTPASLVHLYTFLLIYLSQAIA
jgi:hypothetical protein